MVIWGVILTVCGVGYAWGGKYLIGNIFVITKSITGVVVDEETGKPIEGAYVECEWWGYRAGIGDSEEIKVGHRITKTDKDGRFKIKRVFRIFPFAYYNTNPEKPLSCICKVTAYTLGYRHRSPCKPIDPEYAKLLYKVLGHHNLTKIGIDDTELAMGLKPVKIELKFLKDEEKFYEYLCGSAHTINELFPNETEKSVYKFRNEFIIESCKRFLYLYPKSKYAPDVHGSIFGVYNTVLWSKKLWLKNRDAALKQYQKMVELYSEDSEIVKNAKEAIEQMEIYYKLKKP